MEKEMQGILLVIQDQTGDSKFELSWDPNDQKAVEEARETFLDLQKNGYIFFECRRPLGIFKKKGKEINQFSEDYKRLFFEKKKITVQQNDEADYKKVGTDFEWYEPQTEAPEANKQYVAAKVVVGG
jgi:hypothetical protein